MATSPNMTTDNKYIVYNIDIVQNSQNIANNTSNVTVKVYVRRTNTGYETTGNGTVYVKINGTQYTAGLTTSQVITNKQITIFNKTLDIPHNGDGTKTLETSCYISHSRFVSSPQWQSFNQTLSTIPRASGLFLRNTSNANITAIETNQTLRIAIDRKADAFRHKVFYQFAGMKRELLNTSSSALSTDYVIPTSDLNNIIASTQANAVVLLETYNGSTLIGSTSKNITINVPANVIPTFDSLTASPINAGADIKYGFVQGLSKAKLTINNPRGVYSSNIASVNITGGGYTGSINPFETGTFSTSGNITFNAYVTDTRGRKSATKSVTINVLPYSVPKTLQFNFFRCNSDGSPNEDGQYININARNEYSSLWNGTANQNTHSVRISYKLTSEANYSPIEYMNTYIDTTNTDKSKIIIISNLITGNNLLLAEKTYDIRLQLYDNFRNIEQIKPLATAFVTMDFKAGGRGIAFGKVSEVDNLIEFDVPVKFNKVVSGLPAGGGGASNAFTGSKFSTYAYWGLTDIDGSTGQFIRSTQNGFLPFEPGGASNIGTAGWRFDNAYFITLDAQITNSTQGLYYTSNRNKKENIKYLSDEKTKTNTTEQIILKGIQDIKLAKYNYIDSDNTYLNFIADDLKITNEQFFNLIGKISIDEETGLEKYNISQININGVLLSALKQALLKIEDLENRISILENK